MTQNLLEILLFLAYLCIALISILIAIYTIAISYVGRETYWSIWRKKKRRKSLERRIKELGEEADVKGIVEEIGSYEEEIREINAKLFYLSVKGAVIVPSVFFLAALIAISYTIYAEPVGTIEFPWGQVLLIRDLPILLAMSAIVVGSFFLLKTLFAVQWAASRIPLPKFKVTFGNSLTENKHQIKESVAVEIAVENIGENIAEDVEVYIFFPPEFTIKRGPGYNIVLQAPSSDYPGYNAALFLEDLIHVDVQFYVAPINVIMPEKAGSYKIPVDICERTIGASEHELTLEISS